LGQVIKDLGDDRGGHRLAGSSDLVTHPFRELLRAQRGHRHPRRPTSALATATE